MTRLGRDDISVVEEYNERRVVVRLQPCQGDENMLEMPRSPQARRGQDTATRDRENVEWWCVGGITCIGGALQAQVIAGRHKVGGLVWVPRSPRCLPTRVQAHTHTQTHTHTHTHTNTQTHTQTVGQDSFHRMRMLLRARTQRVDACTAGFGLEYCQNAPTR